MTLKFHSLSWVERLPAGRSTCSLRSAAQDVIDGDLAGAHLLGIEPDAHGGLDVAAQEDVPDARQRRELILELVLDVLHELALGPVAAQRDPHEGLVVRIELHDDRRVRCPWAA